MDLSTRKLPPSCASPSSCFSHTSKCSMAGQQKSVTVCVTGAAGQIAYSLIPLLLDGRTFGPDVGVHLRMLDIPPAVNVMKGVVMEIEDVGFPLLLSASTYTDAEEAFNGVDVVAMLGAFPRKAGMQRKDLLEKNCGIFAVQGKALDKVAKKSVKIVVVGNPANTNCLILQKNAPSIPKENFSALTRLDHNRAIGQIAAKVGAKPQQVANVCIFGNHSRTQYPYVDVALIRDGEKANPVRGAVGDDEWLDNEFVSTIQERGAAVIQARGLSSALSAAMSISDHLRDWVMGTKPGEFVSMAVTSDGSYGVAEGLIFSFPVKCEDGKWEIIPNLPLTDKGRERMNTTEQELVEERDTAMEILDAK
uniref:Malate dehydrogenase n=1 Tax=Palpitomonas bilix TaxID=652834 RepID=A0A7S3G4F2_9EUKA